MIIIKGIGLVLLALLGLVLLLIVLVLLVPVRYRASGSYYGAVKADGGISWLLHIISCQVRYEEELEIFVKIFGKKIFSLKPLEKESEMELKEENVSKADESADDKPDAEKKDTAERKDSDIDQDEDETEVPDPQPCDLEADEKKASDKSRKLKKSKIGQKKKKKNIIQKICDKLKVLKEKKDKALAFINNEDNRNTFRLVKKQIFCILRHILPQKIDGKIKFGFDDPYTTGQILTYISPFYALYAKSLMIIPVFEESALEGNLKIKGRIRIGTILVFGIRVLFDKNFRYLLKQWRNL